MDAVERGQSFTVTRDGRPMGQLVPLQRRFVRREQFSTTSATAATVDLAGFRADQDKALDTGWDDALPFGAEEARLFGRLSAAVKTAGRTPRRRIADLMIAATAAANGLPLYTTNPRDYEGLEALADIVAVRRSA